MRRRELLGGASVLTVSMLAPEVRAQERELQTIDELCGQLSATMKMHHGGNWVVHKDVMNEFILIRKVD